MLCDALEETGRSGFHRSVLDALPDVSPLLRLALSLGLAPAVTRRLVAATRSPNTTSPVAVEGLDAALRPRELQVLRLLADGLTNDELAARLGIRTTTVKVHLRRLYQKLGAKSRSQALARARALAFT